MQLPPFSDRWQWRATGESMEAPCLKWWDLTKHKIIHDMKTSINNTAIYRIFNLALKACYISLKSFYKVRVHSNWIKHSFTSVLDANNTWTKVNIWIPVVCFYLLTLSFVSLCYCIHICIFFIALCSISSCYNVRILLGSHSFISKTLGCMSLWRQATFKQYSRHWSIGRRKKGAAAAALSIAHAQSACFSTRRGY